MKLKVEEYFQLNPDISVLFVFEDIENYVETTKQHMLYKILDLLQSCQIQFVFLATSMKLDIIDSFEKRIKSRFSHRSELLYNLSLEKFREVVISLLREQEQLTSHQEEKKAYGKLEDLMFSGIAMDVLEESLCNGKGYEYMA